MCLNKLLIGPRTVLRSTQYYAIYLDSIPHCEPLNCTMTWDSHFTADMFRAFLCKDMERLFALFFSTELAVRGILNDIIQIRKYPVTVYKPRHN